MKALELYFLFCPTDLEENSPSGLQVISDPYYIVYSMELHTVSNFYLCLCINSNKNFKNRSSKQNSPSVVNRDIGLGGQRVLSIQGPHVKRAYKDTGMNSRGRRRTERTAGLWVPQRIASTVSFDSVFPTVQLLILIQVQHGQHCQRPSAQVKTTDLTCVVLLRRTVFPLTEAVH